MMQMCYACCDKFCLFLQASDPAMHPKFCRLTATAKGFLIRRLLRTEKVQMIIQTIKDTVELVLKLYEEFPQLKIRGSTDVRPEDANLCRRLFQQVEFNTRPHNL